MKTISARFPRSKRGMALISVLAVLLLLTLLVVAFLSRTTSARTASTSYHATANTRLLADMAVNIVQAQINEATTVGLTSTGAPANGTSPLYTWGSQPGAIRVFVNNTSTPLTGSLAYVYRLYSATPVQATGNTPRKIDVSTSVDPAATKAAYTAMNADLPLNANWSTYTAQWCDLNSSTIDNQGRYHFPIIDPRDPAADPTANPTTVGTLWNSAALKAAMAAEASSPSPSNASAVTAARAMAMNGFSIQPPSTITNPASPVSPAPMPVRWLYVLKDGSIISPDAPTTPSNVLTFANALNASGAADVPSVTNPIVGRIAYWTDDDSSKININTAAGDDVVRAPNTYAADSIFWTTPTFSTPDDLFLAQYQPIEGEIQRYPGHPGGVGLNSTLSILAGLTSPLSYTDFYSLLPRYTAGGSVSSTVYVPWTGGAAPFVPLTANRLYTSIGEMLFKADRTHSALVTDTTSEQAAAAAVERANFFLTAHSSSSELNLFGEPRISIWPLTTARAWASQAQSETPLDQLICFDSTIARTAGGSSNQFYFQRTDPASSVTDCNIPNNIKIFNYLYALTNNNIPGFGLPFTNKYLGNASSTSTKQIISEIFDYVRTIDMNDPLLLQQTPNQTASYGYGQNWGLNYASPVHGGISPGQGIGNLWGNGYRGGAGTFQVVPSANQGLGVNGWKTQGLGAFPLPVEVSLHFVALGLGATSGSIEVPVDGRQFCDPNVASDNSTPVSATYPVTPTYAFTTPDAIIPERMLYPPAPGAPITTQTSSAAFDAATKTNPPTAAYQNPPGGRPTDWSTAMQAFIYVSFINPGQVTSRSQPMYCYSISGFANGGNFTVTDPSHSTTPIGLYFPGTLSNPLPAHTVPLDEEKVIVDNSDGGGFINGWIGDWIFGYIPWMGSVGDNNYGGNPASLAPQQTTWNIANAVSIAPANVSGLPGNWAQDPAVLTPQTVSGRCFPYYSQIFCISGEQKYTGTLTPTPVTNPTGNPNPAGIFTFNGATIKINMFDASVDGQTIAPNPGAGVHLVSSYSVVFPKGTFPLPTYGPSDYHLVGTMNENGQPERWHQGLDNASGSGFYNSVITANDTVESVTLSPTWSDARDLAVYTNNASTSTFTKHPNYPGVTTSTPITGMAHDLMADSVVPFVGNYSPTNWGRLVTQAVGGAVSYAPAVDTNPLASTAINYPTVPPRLDGAAGLGLVGQGAFTASGVPGDWDNGTIWYPDGPWDNFPDEGALVTNAQYDDSTGQVDEGASWAYYDTGNLAQKGGVVSTFSPNRMMPSPVMFGSLPTGIIPTSTNTLPWQTLLFRPGPHAGNLAGYHPGERNQPRQGDPADELLLDLFWMPQVEPYPISQPFVTEGKINLNYEIQPFMYITRDSALRALMASEKISVMPDGVCGNYKTSSYFTLTTGQMSAVTKPNDPNGNQRLPIDPDQTLGLNPDTTADPHQPSAGTSFTFPGQTAQTSVSSSVNEAWYDYQTTANGLPGQTRFFRSAAELCDMFLVPQTYDWQDFSGFNSSASHAWYKAQGNNYDFALVGDNNRERPYADLYSRVTTKSNTYTVFFTVQSLKNAEPQVNSAGTTPGQQMWDETKGAVTGEYRGSTIVERYIDSNEKLPDYLDNPATLVSLEPYYKWRVIESQQFAP